ncbi:MAG: hypothetical protein L6R35_005793, partial [Caloplaca aegaea]
KMNFSILCYIVSLISISHGLDLPETGGSLTQFTDEIGLEVGFSTVICNGMIYGAELSQASCVQAWQKMPRTNINRRYGNSRVHGPNLVQLPLRYLSDDGLCAVDVNLKRNAVGSVGDVTTELTLATMAKEVLDQCVAASRVGGQRVNFSTYNDIAVAFRKYEPSVDCDGTPHKTPVLAHCEEAMEDLPARRERVTFIRTDTLPRPQRYVTLPAIFSSRATGASRCSVGVYLADNIPLDKVAWFDIWAAGVEIMTMCVQHGMSGVVGSLEGTPTAQDSLPPPESMGPTPKIIPKPRCSDTHDNYRLRHDLYESTPLSKCQECAIF